MPEPSSTTFVRPAPQLRSILAHLGLSLLSMLLLALAFPQPGWWFLAHIALVPMTLHATWAFKWKRLLWTNYLASYTWWLIMLGWLIGVTGGGYAALAAYMAVYYTAFVLIFRAIDKQFRLPAVLTLPMVFVSLEFIRGTFLEGGMAWFGLGHSQASYLPGHGAPWLIQVADLAGDWTVSFIVAMTNGMIVDLVRGYLSTSATRLRLRAVLPSFATWLVIFIFVFAYGYTKMMDTFDHTQTVSVAVIQTNVPQSNKLRPTVETMTDDWNRMIALTKQALAANPKPDIIVWPETMVPIPLNPEQLEFFEYMKVQKKDPFWISFHEQIAALAAEHRVHVFVGSGTETKTMRSNSAFHYLPDGKQAGEYYSKIDLVPFGEYIPWVDNWPALKEWFLENLSPYGKGKDYSLARGTRRTVFEVTTREGQKIRVTTPICFEDAFARSSLELCYDRTGKRCDLMLNLTNDGWYPGTHQGLQHVQMAAMRCVETRVPMARSVNTGVSVFIDSAGRVGPFVTGRSGEVQQIDGFAVSQVALDPRSTVFGAVGTIPVLTLTIITACLTLWAAVKSRRRNEPQMNTDEHR